MESEICQPHSSDFILVVVRVAPWFACPLEDEANHETTRDGTIKQKEK
jgi:hypothetical protein